MRERVRDTHAAVGLDLVPRVPWRSVHAAANGRRAVSSPPADRARRGRRCSRSRHCSSACCRAESTACPCAQSSRRRRMGSGSTSRISLPTYCNCRLRPPHAVIERAATIASTRRSGNAASTASSPRRFGSSPISASPISWSACISALRRVLDGGRSSGPADSGAASACKPPRGRRWSRSSGRGIVLAEKVGRARALERSDGFPLL